MDSLIMPSNPILDYHTEYSGITEALMKGVDVELSQVI